MRFIVDAPLPPAVVHWLRARGYEAEHVRRAPVDECSDHKIWLYAKEKQAVVMTKDADFRDLVILSESGPAVIWLRLGNVSLQELLHRLDETWHFVWYGLEVGDRLIVIFP